ncbi:MAG: hypothetical protein ACD_3C00093G0001 [uncultured bacterium (gcode 4)]|uniref:Uncharacterized protein n=1 Tax=uncultured bacterium (gcode 4) TaxID=1234023 RepID=K2GXK6_9BACT|nr:MAG: hypothetical protein ACD_3C00093G0001 [uncultured bacterium (gcode 4)]
MDIILKLSQSKNTIYTFDELREIFWTKNIQVLKNKLNYYTKVWILERIVKWVYALKNKEINRFELANKIYSPSYISFFSALYHYWVIFQYEEDVYLAYKKTDTRKTPILNIRLKSLKKDILLNPNWIINNWIYSIASAERAFLDTIYLYPNMHFDNLWALNQDKILELLKIYNSKTMEKRIKDYFLNI